MDLNYYGSDIAYIEGSLVIGYFYNITLFFCFFPLGAVFIVAVRSNGSDKEKKTAACQRKYKEGEIRNPGNEVKGDQPLS